MSVMVGKIIQQFLLIPFRSLGFSFEMNSRDLVKWEVSRECVVINRKLGEGAFGTVYGGEVNLPKVGWTAVAVKTLKIGSTAEERLDFLSEAEAMKRFEHKNIVKLLGKILLCSVSGCLTLQIDRCFLRRLYKGGTRIHNHGIHVVW